jgi:DNA-binding transcriptional MerR regulator
MFKIGEFARIAQISVRMLRHYDKLGIIKPLYIDRDTGYRYYSLDQLPRLHRLLALRDLGLSLEQVTHLLDEDVSVSELRGMLRLKEAELRQQISEARLRLERVEQRLERLEEQGSVPQYEVVVKAVPDLFALACHRTLPPLTPQGFGEFFYEGSNAIRRAGLNYQLVFALSYNAFPVFQRRFSPEWPYQFEAVYTMEQASVPALPLGDGYWLHPKQIPGFGTVASTIHTGPDRTRPQAHQALCQWIERHGYAVDGPVRDIYLRRGLPDTSDSADHLTEIQYPIRPVNAVREDDAPT